MKCSFCGTEEYDKIFENKDISDKKICNRCARLCKKLLRGNSSRFSNNKIIAFPTVNTLA